MDDCEQEKTMTYTTEQVARVCHAANTELQRIAGDECPSLPWDAETAETRRGAVAGVDAALRGETPEELHGSWAAGKRATGWRCGAEKDAGAKTHPCLVPYAELPESERVKDAVFAAIVRAMSGCTVSGELPVPASPDLCCARCGADPEDAEFLADAASLDTDFREERS